MTAWVSATAHSIKNTSNKYSCDVFHKNCQGEKTMIQPVILEKLEELPESLQTEVLHYIEFLIEKHTKNSTEEKLTNKRRVAGTMKGMFVLPLPNDFDEPLQDMKEYME
ncbi:DUF2281 domain-containing protein [uncultured Nostoc sp.]|uniref:type II toxin-antitoxin system VapB family antitoxin n=3 Tax=Nostoc TaxID=1177 RepID=UPI0035CBDA66